MYSLQYRPQMDHTQYLENEAATEGYHPLIFFILIMVPLRPVLSAVHGLYIAYVWPIYGLCMTYMNYIWPYVHVCQVTLPGFLSMLI